MDNTVGSRDPLGYTNDYVRRLVIERRHIYERLYNPGGSVILRSHALVDNERPVGYSTDIGNNFHLDLIQLDIEFREAVKAKELTHKQIAAILTWADGMTSQQAADYLGAKGPASIRRLRSKANKKLRERLNDSRGKAARGRGQSPTSGRRQGEQDDAVS